MTTAKKKSLYEVLGVSNKASAEEIQSAYESSMAQNDSHLNPMSAEDQKNQTKLLKLAHGTLSNQMLRDSYDSSLIAKKESTQSLALLLNDKSLKEDGDAIRADALRLKADSLSLQADLLSLRANSLVGDSHRDGSFFRNHSNHGSIDGFPRPLRNVAIAIAAVLLIFSIQKAVFVSSAAKVQESLTSPVMEEKAYLQEYYQTHGVKPKNRAEAQLWDEERRIADQQKREKLLTEAERANIERQQQRFEEDSRKLGRQTSSDLERSEENLRRANELAEIRKEELILRAKERQDKKDEAERLRIQKEQSNWKEILRRPEP